jgi:hypothetical protein
MDSKQNVHTIRPPIEQRVRYVLLCDVHCTAVQLGTTAKISVRLPQGQNAVSACADNGWELFERNFVICVCEFVCQMPLPGVVSSIALVHQQTSKRLLHRLLLAKYALGA